MRPIRNYTGCISQTPPLVSPKLETSPIQASESSQWIICISNLSHPLHILQREAGKWILKFACITHVDKLRRQAFVLVLLVPVVDQ